MNYKAGDRVKIKSLDWYNKNKNNRGDIISMNNPHWRFVANQADYCGQIATITSVSKTSYRLEHIPWNWTDEMIEGLAEETDTKTSKYKIGNFVCIKNDEWYENNKNERGDVICGNIAFSKNMQKFCGRTVTIIDVNEVQNIYTAVLKKDYFSIEKHTAEVMQLNDEMIEGLVEEETKPKYEDEVNGEYYSTPKYLVRPSGYQFKDENGNEIHALKIVLEKANTLKTQSNNMEIETHRGYCTTEEKKEEIMEEKRDKAKAPNLIGEDYSGKRIGYKIPNGYEFDKIENSNIIFKPIKPKYPKTYEECCKVLGVDPDNYLTIRNVHRYDGEEETVDYERDLLGKFDSLWELIICRDAYWKIAGEEMGLGKPWEPDWNTNELKYIIYYENDRLWFNDEISRNTILAFPTEEMRDAFYENFKEEIEECKELL